MTQTTIPGPRTAAWTELTSHATRLNSVPTRELFARDPGRFERFSREKVGLLMDFSRQRFDEIVLNATHCGGMLLYQLLELLATALLQLC